MSLFTRSPAAAPGPSPRGGNPAPPPCLLKGVWSGHAAFHARRHTLACREHRASPAAQGHRRRAVEQAAEHAGEQGGAAASCCARSAACPTDPLTAASATSGTQATGPAALSAFNPPVGRLVKLRYVNALHLCGKAEQRRFAVQPLRPAPPQALPNLHQQLLAVAQGHEVEEVAEGLCTARGDGRINEGARGGGRGGGGLGVGGLGG